MPELAIARGDFPGVTHINKFGRNTDIAGSGTEEIWDGNYAYNWPTSASITHIRAAADSATTRGVDVEVQGLDTNWALVTQTVTTDGTNSTTEVALTTALRRVFRMKVLDGSAMDQNIWVGDSDIANAADAEGIITAGNNQTLMALYTVPASHTAFVTSYYAYSNPLSGSNVTSNDIKLWARDNANSYAPQLKHVVGLPDDGFFQHTFSPFVKFNEKTDIYLTSSPTAVQAVDVSAGFDLILVDETVQ